LPNSTWKQSQLKFLKKPEPSFVTAFFDNEFSAHYPINALHAIIT